MILRRIFSRGLLERSTSFGGCVDRNRSLARFSKGSPAASDAAPESEENLLEAKRTSALSESEFTDFQKTFGFHEDIALMQQENLKREKRKYIRYSIGALMSVGVLTSVFLVLIDPAVGKSVKQAYLVHSTNLKLKRTAILNSRGSSLKKIQIIAEYFAKMKEYELVQPTYTLILLEEVQQILARHLILTQNEEILREIPALLREIEEIMTRFTRFQAIQERYVKILESICQVLVFYHVEHADAAQQAFKILQSDSEHSVLARTMLFGFVHSKQLRSKNNFIQLLRVISTQQQRLTESEFKQLMQEGCAIAERVQDVKEVSNEENNGQVTYEEFLQFQKESEAKYTRSILYSIVPLIDGLDSQLKNGLKEEIIKVNNLVSVIH